MAQFKEIVSLIPCLVFIIVFTLAIFYLFGLLITHLTYQSGTGLIRFVDEKLIEKKINNEIIIYLTLDQDNIFYRHARVSKRKANGKNILRDYSVVEYW